MDHDNLIVWKGQKIGKMLDKLYETQQEVDC